MPPKIETKFQGKKVMVLSSGMLDPVEAVVVGSGNDPKGASSCGKITYYELQLENGNRMIVPIDQLFYFEILAEPHVKLVK